MILKKKSADDKKTWKIFQFIYLFYFQWPKCWLARKPGWTPAIPFSCNHCLGSDPNHANCPLQPHNPWWLQHQHHNVLHQLHAATSRLPWQPDAETWLREPCSIPEKQFLPLSKVRKGDTFRIRPFNSKIIFFNPHLNQNIHIQMSRLNEHPKQTFNLMDMKI